MTALSHEARPSRVPDTVVHPAGQGRIVHLQDAPTEVALNPTAFALWELCDGRTTVSEMVDAVCDLFTVSRRHAEQDVEDALDQMRTAGIIR